MSGARARGLLVALIVGAPALASAKPKQVAPPPPPPSVATPELLKELEGPDEGHAIEAARKLGEGGDAAAVTALVDGLEHGAPPRVAAAMARALGGKGDSKAVAMLERYARHRSAEVRKAALTALASLPSPAGTAPADKRALAPLLAALGDSDPEVRGLAAKLLGERRERGAEERLIKLLEHRDASSAPALAAIGTAELAHRLSEMLGSVPDPLLCAALGEMLKRSDFGPEPIRVEIVRTLGKVPGAESTTALVEYLGATEKGNPNRPSRLEAQKIIDERGRQ
jgi:HEAT repeat protein